VELIVQPGAHDVVGEMGVLSANPDRQRTHSAREIMAAWRRLLIALGIGIVVIVCRFPRTSMVAAALAITSALWKLGLV
jgi:hypothetical protein